MEKTLQGNSSKHGSPHERSKNSAGSKSGHIEIPSINLPKGGGAIKGIDEKFAVNPVNGTASFSIPLPLSQSRATSPALSLAYNSGGGNGIFGLGWSLSLPSIKRKTGKQLPQYDDGADSDTFLFSEAEDLVPEFAKADDGRFAKDTHGNYIIKEKNSTDGLFTIRYYKPRIEGLYARIERWRHKKTGETKWRIITKENVTTLFGWTSASRISDPADANRVFEWLPEFVFDDKGNCTRYIYKKEDDQGFDRSHLHNKNRFKNGILTYTNLYLERVLYGNKTPCSSFSDDRPSENDYLFEVVFDYGEYDVNPPYARIKPWEFRNDPCSDYKPGFEIRVTRLCRRVLMFHHFDELPGGIALVKSFNFGYDASRHGDFTFLRSITHYGHIKQDDGSYTHKCLPPIEFEYQQHDWSKEIKTGTEGLAGTQAHFTDLFNEGLPGILSERGGNWYYKRNLGRGQFERPKAVNPKPSFSTHDGKVLLADLDADGGKQFVNYSADPKGYFELNEENQWQGFRSFKSLPNIALGDPNMKWLDLDGDGRPELVVAEEKVFTWYPSEGRNGYGLPNRALKPISEEEGPRVAFADSKQSIFLADMSGDGLTDIVRIRNGEVCYWPNLGYGKFGAKRCLDNAPTFDHPDAFNPASLRLADLDGSGTSDIIYLGKNKITCWKNLSGNGLSTTPFEIDNVAGIDSHAQVSVTDLLGNGTACIVLSGARSTHGAAPMKYIDLANGKKPYVMTGYRNNLGKEVSLKYTPSTQFYLEDRKAGKPWTTKLHFPVHCVSKTITKDKICGYEFVTEYKYHHGYYDHAEREFRGFGMIEQIDAESFEHWKKGHGSTLVEDDLHQDPVVVRTWYHTGAFVQNRKILDQFAKDTWHEQLKLQGVIVDHHEEHLPDAHIVFSPAVDATYMERLSPQEWREALRACKGMQLRSEVFAKDAKNVAPFSVATQNFVIELVQPQGKNKHAVFALHPSESRTYNYERNADDPRITHTITIKRDEYGNALESVSIVYSRIRTDEQLPALTRRAQEKTSIFHTQNSYTNDCLGADEYRLRLLSEAKKCELTGVTRRARYFRIADFKNILDTATEIPFHETSSNAASAGPQKRRIEHTRSLFYRNDLSGPLPLNTLESKGIPFETYRMSHTPELVKNIFGDRVDAEVLREGGFVHCEGDGNWWAPAGKSVYLELDETVVDAQRRFFTPVACADAFGSITKVKYDDKYFLFLKETEDVFGNKSRVERFNFRTLTPQRVRDVNNNISESIADELGMVTAMALFGKGNEADDLTGLNEVASEGERVQIDNFFGAADSHQLTRIGKSLLNHATARFVYDFDAYRKSGKPAAVASIVREVHYRDDSDSPIQLSFEYSNGLGKVVMSKTQAAPGVVTQVTVDPDNTVATTRINTAKTASKQIRWIGTGRTVLNNKGNAVKEYEPYFSTTHAYEDTRELTETGCTPKLYYDAAGRLVKKEMPDGTFSRVAFDAWTQTTYDANDTVLESVWYQNRVNRLIDEQLVAEGKDPVREKQAALKAAKHASTPSIEHFDALRRSVLTVEHNRHNSTGCDEFYFTHSVFDTEGNLTAVTDASGNTIAQYKYDMLGNLVYQSSLAAGQRWLLNNILGAPLRTWDERDHEFQYYYDLQHRPARSVIINRVGAATEHLLNNVFDRIIYGENLLLPDGSNRAVLQDRNVLAKVVRHYDTGGLIETSRYNFKGQPVSTTRRLFKKYMEVANWTDENLHVDLEEDAYTFATKTDALGRTAEQTAPNGNITTYSYNESGLLNSQTVTDASTHHDITYVKHINYNEKGQFDRIIYGNDVVTRFHYDKETFRLKRLVSFTKDNEILQDWLYTFDPVGNITHIENKCIKDRFFDNKRVTGCTQYTYDALYRLIEATGKENNTKLSHGGRDNWNDAAFIHALNPGDPLQMRNYVQYYKYDSVGNILQMRHQADGNNWTRTYQYEAGSNRLDSTQIGSETYYYSHHARHGFVTAMPHLADMTWNFREELVKTVRQKRNDGGAPETTYYQYDKDGRRIRKVTEHEAAPGTTPAKKDERIYIDTYELYKKHSGPNAGLERSCLSLVNGDHRFVLIESRNDVDDATEKQLVRYQLHNHLGSASVELDSRGRVISYEEYHPYGTTAYQARNSKIRAAAKRYRYTGMERDEESGLEYHNARYYIPWLGRWLSCDPLYKDRQVLSENAKGEREDQEGIRHSNEHLREVARQEKSNGQWRRVQRKANAKEDVRHPHGKGELAELRELNLYAYAALDPIVFQDPSGNVPIFQAWHDAYKKSGTAGKVGYGFLFIFAWLAHVVVNLVMLILSVTLFNPGGFFGLWDFTWGAPQSVIGLVLGVVAVLFGASVLPHKGVSTKVELPSYMKFYQGYGVSLGPVTFGHHGFSKWDHEAGHTWQSRVLGPFYLFIVGIPSAAGAQWTESWANKWAP